MDFSPHFSLMRCRASAESPPGAPCPCCSGSSPDSSLRPARSGCCVLVGRPHFPFPSSPSARAARLWTLPPAVSLPAGLLHLLSLSLPLFARVTTLVLESHLKCTFLERFFLTASFFLDVFFLACVTIWNYLCVYLCVHAAPTGPQAPRGWR